MQDPRPSTSGPAQDGRRRATDDAPAIRPLEDADALDVIELMAGVFGEYPGCVTDVDGEMPELRRLASYYAEHGGRGWVAVRAGRVVATIGVTRAAPGPSGEPTWEIRKLYVHRTERGAGLADRLLDLAEGAAREAGAQRIELWSDTRFHRAHRFYERRGYRRSPETRELGDLSRTVEHHFERATTPTP